jgi:surface polysaccharide O-acyltransferase-like enzyme
MLTGYLMSKKTLCKKYYLGLVRILLIYVISGIACVLFKIKGLYLDVDFKTGIIELFNYTLAPYGWYIELYIGLFLLIPFLNILYNNIDTQKHKKALLITFFVLTVLPSVFNIFSLAENEVWYNPISTENITKILPTWWVGFYPLTFYFTGCYIREYGLKIKNSVAIILLVLSIFAFGGFNFFRSYNTTFESGQYIGWQGIEPFVMSVLLFVLLSRIKAYKMPKWLRWIFWKMSDAALGIYLLSYIFDTIAYPILLNSVPVMTDRLKYYFVIIPAVFVCSLVASLLLNLLLKIIDFAIGEVKSVFATLKA